jgi:hypothetical protein
MKREHAISARSSKEVDHVSLPLPAARSVSRAVPLTPSPAGRRRTRRPTPTTAESFWSWLLTALLRALSAPGPGC